MLGSFEEYRSLLIEYRSFLIEYRAPSIKYRVFEGTPL